MPWVAGEPSGVECELGAWVVVIGMDDRLRDRERGGRETEREQRVSRRERGNYLSLRCVGATYLRVSGAIAGAARRSGCARIRLRANIFEFVVEVELYAGYCRR